MHGNPCLVGDQIVQVTVSNVENVDALHTSSKYILILQHYCDQSLPTFLIF